MIDDILTVMWKERKSIFRYQGSRGRFLLVLLTPVLLAVVIPWQWGADWVRQVPSVVLSILIPVVIVGITVPDSFAGERERHTLGTLLASRLPDRAILFGKLIVSIVFAWGVTVVVLLASLITVNIAHGEGELILYTPIVALADLAVRGPFAAWQAAGSPDTTALARRRAVELARRGPAALDRRRAEQLAQELARAEEAIAAGNG